MFFLLRILIVFTVKIVEEILRFLLRCAIRPTQDALSLSDRVLILEHRRQARGYRPGWLDHRCREEGLSEVLAEMRRRER